MGEDPEVVVEDSPVPGSRPGSGPRSRPASTARSRPTSRTASRPASAQQPPSRVSSGSSNRAWHGGDEPDTASIRSLDKQEEAEEDTEELIQTDEPGSNGCWASCKRSVGSMWATNQMHSGEDREIFVRTTIRELVVYCAFLTVLCLLAFGTTSSVAFFYTQVMSNLFQTDNYNGISQTADVWTYLNGDLLDGIYWEESYNNGDDNEFVCPGVQGGPCPLPPSDRNILYENRLLGLPRLRMLRVRNDSCDVHADFKNAIKVCYANYDPSIEDKNPFGPGYRVVTSDLAWSYQEEESLGGISYTGLLATYTGAGSVQTLASLKNDSQDIVNELMELLWIDRGTRFVTVDFTVYNANVNLFCIVKITFEFPATGGVIVDSRFRTVKLLSLVNVWDYFTLGAGLVFVAFVIYYLIEEILEIAKHKCGYFRGMWNVMDLVVLLNSIASIILYVHSFVTIEANLTPILADPDSYGDFSTLGVVSVATTNVMAILVFIAWIKLFKYISFNKTMTQLSNTLARSAKDVGGFGVMFFIVFFAFAQLGYLLFGSQLKDYSTFVNAIFALLRLILGDFDYPSIEAANRTLGPTYFVVYVFFVFFVLLNMFLAIINDSYVVVKEEIQNEKDDFEVGDYLRRGYNNVLGKVGSRDRNIDLENALKMANSDGIVTYDEIRQNLKKCNFSDLEIEMFFCRYDVDGNILLDRHETNKVLSDLGEDKVPENRPASGRSIRSARRQSMASAGRRASVFGGVSSEEYTVLTRRVDRMEQSIGSIVSKIDTVLVKLDYMERTKSKRKAAMSKILGTITEDDGMDDATKRAQVEALVRGELESWDHSRPSSSSESGRQNQ